MSLELRKPSVNDIRVLIEMNEYLFESELRFNRHLNIKWPSSKGGKKYFLSRILDKNSYIKLIIYNNQIVGYLSGIIHKSEDYKNISIYAKLENIFILDGYRGKGGGSFLFDDFMAWVNKKNVDDIFLNMYGDNTVAREFYRKKGFNDFSFILRKKIT